MSSQCTRRCSVLGFYQALSGTELVVLRARYAVSGTDIAYGTAWLHARYAVSGTGIAYGAVCLLRSRYAMPGTDIADALCYQEGRCRAEEVLMPIFLRLRYAMSGTDVAPSVRLYVALRACYALPCTGVADGQY
eukprot:3463619-Rhodomonas_salina.3